jgi:hypothetical protein
MVVVVEICSECLLQQETGREEALSRQRRGKGTAEKGQEGQQVEA